MNYYRQWKPYVPVETRRRMAANEVKRLAKKGHKACPIRIVGRAIATTFWGQAWCDNLENYSDFSNRMPRGRTYARNGSIVDLQIQSGEITSLVSGSRLYKISIQITKLNPTRWKSLRQKCSSEIKSLLDLMRGQLSPAVMQQLTDPKGGLFPEIKEIKFRCNCPDVAILCKHVAATLYGVGHRLDAEPELFFLLRGVRQSELVSQAMAAQKSGDLMGLKHASSLAGEDLGAMFGIELASTAPKADKRPDAVPRRTLPKLQEDTPSTTGKKKAPQTIRQRKKSSRDEALAESSNPKAKNPSQVTKKPAPAGARKKGPTMKPKVGPKAGTKVGRKATARKTPAMRIDSAVASKTVPSRSKSGKK